MKRKVLLAIPAIMTFLLGTVLFSCGENRKDVAGKLASEHPNNKQDSPSPERSLTEDFKKYWYAGDAEITSYTLKQARYGEMREGHAVLIYVTEPFLNNEQVKADEHHADNIPVLKLNTTKNFLTGIYPYSIMTSSFYGVHDNKHAVKITNSVLEWCGHVYAQLNNRDKFEVTAHSYFEKEGDQHLTLEKANLENEIWNKIRINPKNLPVGDFEMVPALEYIRLGHIDFKAYQAVGNLQEDTTHCTYEIRYPELQRTLVIKFGKDFPYPIENWEESYKSGFGSNAIMLSTEATKIKTLKTTYWQQNKNKDVFLRDSLGL